MFVWSLCGLFVNVTYISLLRHPMGTMGLGRVHLRVVARDL